MLDKEYTNLLESLATAVIVTDVQLNIVYANMAAEQLCGISRHRLVAQHNIVDFIDKKETAVINTFKETDYSDGFQGFSAAGVRFTAYPGVSSKADIAVYQYNSIHFKGLLIEIHTIARQEKLINQIQQNYQYSAARDLIRSLAHEIKNPLGGIRGAAQLLEMSFSSVDGIKEYTNVIIEQTDRLKELVNNLLGPQKPNPLEKVNIHYLIEKVLKLISMQQDSKEIKIIRDYDPSLPELSLDINSVEQVLINIVNNAVQALNEVHTENPYILIKTRASTRTIIRDKKHPTSLNVIIENNGPKIPEKILQTVFYPMVTTKTNGNGLGLSIALNIIERHNGTIECNSDDHKTSFKIILPYTKEDTGEKL
ncbi:MAG: nitrogen regulation protein NR(II) [Succinivibrio sp.]|uniref:nitrogen regulation protein NR(II) n=1 Tax=Succinivibrio sp. TaxID=2053619 RepID=UPI002F91CA3A|nr:ATP-binding protein [Succinatimonas hippei]